MGTSWDLPDPGQRIGIGAFVTDSMIEDDDDFVDAERILNVSAQDKPTGKSNQITITNAKPDIQRTAERQGAGSLMVQGPKPAGAISCTPTNLVAKQVDNGVDPPPG